MRDPLPEEKKIHKRNLPHWDSDHAVLFLTARLYGSLPKCAIKVLRETREKEIQRLKKQGYSDLKMKQALQKCRNLYFGKFNDLLDSNKTGPHWLKEDRIARIWSDALHHFDNDRYELICSTIMSNHVHFIFYGLDRSLSEIMKALKGFSAYKANKILGRVGENFWQEESYDRVIRDELELSNKINYTLNNPVKMGLAGHWYDWKYNYVNKNFLCFVDP